MNDDRESLTLADEVARAYAKSGFPAAVRRGIELKLQLAKRRYVDPAEIAFDYATIGEKDQAFAWFEKSYAEKSRPAGVDQSKFPSRQRALRSAVRCVAQEDGAAAIGWFRRDERPAEF